jgi:hypothetical protein
MARGLRNNGTKSGGVLNLGQQPLYRPRSFRNDLHHRLARA